MNYRDAMNRLLDRSPDNLVPTPDAEEPCFCGLPWDPPDSLARSHKHCPPPGVRVCGHNDECNTCDGGCW